MSKATPELILNCNGTRLNVRKSHLVEKLQIFFDDPALLTNPEYEVHTSVGVPPFTDFVKSVQGESIDITAANYGGLSALCSEFGFADLLSELFSFKDSHPETFREPDSTAFSASEAAMKGIWDHEERLAEHARKIWGFQSENARLAWSLRHEETKVASLARRLEV
jgi:hypothetical protein